MTAITADFSGGSNGASVSTGDPGHATVWDEVISSGVLKYSNAHVIHSALALKVGPLIASTQAYVAWGTHAASLGAQYGRIYLYMTGAPADYVALVRGSDDASDPLAGNQGFVLFVSPAGKLHIASGNAGQSPDFTNAIPTNQWCRVEWHVVNDPSSGSVEVKLFATADDTVATETQTYTGLNTRSAMQALGFGNVYTASADTSTYWMGLLVANATAYPGPFPVNSIAPAITGSTPVGSLLTAGNGTWGGTFNYTYQWTRDGSNIGGATSSTYTTVSGDIGHAIGCTVTATGQQATNESAAQASGNTVTVTSGAAVNSGMFALMGT